MNRSEFYGSALRNLGLVPTVQRAWALRGSSSPEMRLTSKYLANPVTARRGTTDLMVFDTIFVEREYSCLDNLQNVRTVIDAGANCGYSSAYFLSKFPGSRVIAVEPDRSNFQLLKKNLAPWGNRAICVEAALWSHETTLNFEQDSTGAGNEWGRRTEEGGTGDTGAGIRAVTVPWLMNELGVETIDVLKVDIEGAETAVFGGGDRSWLGAVRNIVIELHGPECQAAVEGALAPYAFTESRSGELSVYLDISPKG